MGPYDNEAGEYLRDDETYCDPALWLELDYDTEAAEDSQRVEEPHRYLWIVPAGVAEIEGSDAVKFATGPHAGEYVEDVIARICRAQADQEDPQGWKVDWGALGFNVIPDLLKRWDPSWGYYHA